MHQRFALSGPLAVLLLFFFGSPAFAQSSGPSGNSPQAVALASKAFAALVGSVHIKDVTLTGTAIRTTGSDVEAGSVTLKALGSALSRLDFNSSSGTRTEVRNIAANGAPGGFWSAPDNASGNFSQHNCMTDSAWFFPGLSVLSQLSNPTLSIVYVGQENRNGESVQHLQFDFGSSNSSSAASASLQHLTTEDIYLDAISLLPVSILLTTHPDNNAGVDISVEVDFSNYQITEGINIPFHIQTFLNGTSFLDITIASVALNSGLTASNFSQ